MISTHETVFAPPRCIILTGPRSPGKARWLDERIASIHARNPNARCAVLLADERLTRTNRFADASPKVDVRCLFMPCLCCPGAADLPRVARAFAGASRAEWLFIELPVLPAASLIAEFDRVVGWPREVAVWLNRDWSRARRAQTLSVFQARLLALADHVVEEPARHAAPPTGAEPPALSLL